MRYFLLAILPSCLLAHDLYMKPAKFRMKPGEVGLLEYHSGDSFPTSEVPPKMERLRDTKVVTQSGSVPLKGLKVDGKMGVATFEAPNAAAFILTSRTIPAFLELPADKFTEYLNHEGLQNIAAWRKNHGESSKASRELYSKHVKSIVYTGASSDFTTKPIGLAIEFVPLADPATIKSGGELPMQVLFQGKPVPANQMVEASSFTAGKVEKTEMRTDSKGQVLVKINRPGLWKMHSILMERRDGKQADWESFWASLTFEIAR